MARRYPLSAWAGTVIATLLGLGGCTCSHGAPPQISEDFGSLGGVPPLDADAIPLLRLARQVLEHSGREGGTAAPVLAMPAGGKRVALALWRPGGGPLVATALGATLDDAVTAAAQALGSKASDVTGRLELDVPTSAEGDDLQSERDEPITGMGLEGVLIARDDGKAAMVLPGEIAERKLLREDKGGSGGGLDASKVRALLASRAGVDVPELDAMRAYRFRADVHVESAAHDGALSVLRGMVVRPAQPDVDLLLAAVRSGADYLVRVMSHEGRYVYMYHPLDERDDPSYGWLRHAGTTYALLEAYEELGTPAYLEKGELALSYLRVHLRDDAESLGKYALDTSDEEQQKVGGAGLALLAFAKDAAITGKRDELETMRALARFILKQQYADGHFRANTDLENDGQKRKKELIYYAGEAVLGLMRVYAIDPQQAYLDAARKAADWIIHVRDAATSEDTQEHDHWMTYALNELYRVTREDVYLQHALKIAHAIQKKQRGADAPAPDLVGTFYDGQTTPASTRLEAYDADIAVSRFAGKPEDWLLGPAREVACFILGQQYDAANGYWLKNPARAEGGVRESLFVADVRIDYVQHAMSAWLHLARLLRDPAYGKTGVPSQDPVR
jgi:hypothetical protein